MGRLVALVLISTFFLSACKTTAEYIEDAKGYVDSAVETAKKTVSCIGGNNSSSECRTSNTETDTSVSVDTNSTQRPPSQVKTNSNPGGDVKIATVKTENLPDNLVPFPSRKNIGTINNKSSFKVMKVFKDSEESPLLATIFHIKNCDIPVSRLRRGYRQSLCEVTLSFIDENGATEESEAFMAYKVSNYGINEEIFYGTKRVYPISSKQRKNVFGESERNRQEFKSKSSSEIENEMSEAHISSNQLLYIRIPSKIMDEKFSAQKALYLNGKFETRYFREVEKKDQEYPYDGYLYMTGRFYNVYPGFTMDMTFDITPKPNTFFGTFYIDDNFGLTPEDIYEILRDEQSIIALAKSYSQHLNAYFTELYSEIETADEARLMFLIDFLLNHHNKIGTNYPEVYGQYLEATLKVRTIKNSNLNFAEKNKQSRAAMDNFMKEYKAGQYPSADQSLFRFKTGVLSLRSISRLFQPLENKGLNYDSLDALYADWDKIHYLTAALEVSTSRWGGSMKNNANIPSEEYLRELDNFRNLKDRLIKRLDVLGTVITCSKDDPVKLTSCQ